MSIKGVIFDVDGTLVDSVDLHARAWQQAFAKFGKSLTFAEVRHQIGKGGDQLMPYFLTDEQMEQFSKELSHYRSNLFRSEYMAKVLPFPRARDLLLRIRETGRRVALATSSNEKDLAEYKRIANIEGLADIEVSASDVENSKPAPDVFVEAAKQLALAPHELVAIGDTPYDGIAARRAGMHFIAVLSGGFEREELVASGAAEIFRDPADMIENLNRSELLRAIKPT